ncbi:hypothetical protein V6N13_122770 [Hibiscus sabdariffa]|uniref:RNase H type-1 domain-containing protein n=1 Tax=Hibiscus sabdariffa TaxID=183260 RepID=A0ABR2P3S4_9ROSI
METNEHLVCSCAFTRRLMQELGLIFDMPSSPDWRTWLFQLFKKLPKDKCAIFVTAIWALWFYWNNKVHDQGSQLIKDIASFVLSYVNDFGVSQKCSANVNSANVNNSSNDRLNPPNENHVKINFDASFNAAQRTSVSGVIVRDTNGYIMAAGSFPLLCSRS